MDCFRRCAEHVQLHPDEPIELVEQLQFTGGVVAVVEGMAAHDVAVLPLDVGVVVGFVWSGSGEEQVTVADPFDGSAFDELAPVIGVQANERER